MNTLDRHIAKILSQNIKAFRMKHKLSQESLAKKLSAYMERGCSPGTISRIERSGSISLKQLSALAEIFGVTESELLREHTIELKAVEKN